MERASFLVIGLAFSSLVAAQEIRVEYDKLTGAVQYSKCKTKKGQLHCKPIDKPKLKEGEAVELKVTNINEFVFKAETSATIDQDTLASRSFGSGFGGFLGSASSMFGNMSFGGFNLGGMQNTFSGSFNMGGAEEGLIPDEMKRELLPLQTRQRDVDQGLDRIVGEVQAVDGTLKSVNDLKLSRNKSLAQIRREKDSLLTSLTSNVPGVLEEGYAMRLERDLTDHVTAARRLADTQHGLLASLNNDMLIAAPKRRLEDLNAVAESFDVAEFDQHIGSIKSISTDIDNATFEYVETVTIDKEDATSLLMNVEIFDQTAIEEPAKATAPQPGRVVRFFPDRWVTPQGQVTDMPCQECKPLKEAEGFYFGSPVDPALGTSAGDVPGRSGAYGLWKRWDRNGMLVEEYFIDRPDLAGMVQRSTSSVPVQKLDDKKAIRIPVDRGLILTTSVGVALSTMLEAPKDYQVIPDTAFGYSILLESSRSNIIPVLASFFHFYWDSEKNVSWGGNVGIGLALAEKSSMNIMGGPSMICGKKQSLIINMGVNATQLERKLEYLPVGEPFETSLAANGTTTRQWDVGIFLGVSFGLGMNGNK